MDPQTKPTSPTAMSSSSSYFTRLPVSVDGVPYVKTFYDKTHLSLLSERLTHHGDDDDLVLVHPDTPLTVPMIICMGMISLLRLDIGATSQQLSEDLLTGTPVGLIEKDKVHPGTYQGVELNDFFGEMHKIKRNDGTVHSIRLEDRWRIQPLSVVGEFKKSTSKTVYGNAIEQELEIPRGSIPAFSRSKALIVTSNKDHIIHSLRSISIGKDPFDKIFTVARTDGFDYQFVGRNNLKLAPQIMFCSDLLSAADMIKQDPEIRLIVIVGSKASDYSNIQYINEDSVPRKIICLLTPEQGQLLEDIKSIGFDAFIWKRPDFTPTGADLQTKSPLVNEHFLTLHALANSSYESHRIDWPDGVSEEVSKTRSRIKKLEKRHSNDDNFKYWLWSLWGLLNKLVQTPFNISEFESWLAGTGRSPEGIKGNFALLASRYESFRTNLDANEQEEINDIFIAISDLVSTLSTGSNPKEAFVAKYISENPGIRLSFSCNNPLFEEYLMSKYSSSSLHSPMKSGKNTSLFVTGWKNVNSFSGTLLAPYRKIIYLGYGPEIAILARNFSTYPAGANSRLDKNIRESLGLDEIHLDIFDTKPLNEHDVEESIQLEEVEKEIELAVDADAPTPPPIQTSSEDTVVPAIKVTLSQGRFIYLNNIHKVARLNKLESDYEMVAVNQLRPGDQLMFASGNRNLFKDVLDIIKNTPEYSQLLTTGEAWRTALIKYYDQHQLTPAKLAKQLFLRGSERSPQTIRLWLEGEIICPERDAVEAIKLLTMDDVLLYKMDEVIDACAKIRKIHMSTGVAIVRRILARAAGSQEHDTFSRTTSIDYQIDQMASQTRVYTILSLSPDLAPVSIKLEGHLQ